MTGLHKVFRTDQGLKAGEIAKLLGITVNVDHGIAVMNKKRELNLTQVLLIVIASLLFTVIAIVAYMYINQFGFFHDAKAAVLQNELH
jgi:hypothetical protein